MTPDQSTRFQALKDPWCGYRLVQELYGLDLEQDQALFGALLSWGARQRRGVEILKPDLARGHQLAHRHHLETFLQVMKLLPMKLAAARLGMDADSLRSVEEALKPKGFYVTSALSDQLAEEPKLRGIIQFFPELAITIFADHDDFCGQLHSAIKKELNIQIKDLRCVTSVQRGETEPQYAYEFDAITLEPIGLRYQVWLDFKKPMHLRPDACALKTYDENEEILRQYLFPGQNLKRRAASAAREP